MGLGGFLSGYEPEGHSSVHVLVPVRKDPELQTEQQLAFSQVQVWHLESQGLHFGFPYILLSLNYYSGHSVTQFVSFK